ncbi:MAG: CHAT domain-containing protein, partial [Ktedonobacteraceae bacterium]
ELADHAAIGKLLEDEALRILYSPFISLKIAELLIFYGELVEDMMSHALGLKAKGDALMMIGHHQAAIDALDASGEEFLRLNDVGNWARSRISWIYCSAWLGHVEEALEQAEQARNMFLKIGEPYWACAIDHNKAMIYEYIGHYQDAVNLYERMLTIFPTLSDQNEISIKRSIVLAEMNKAINLAWLGEFEDAYYLQQKVQAEFTALGELDLMLTSLENLANLDYSHGYYGSALRRYYQAHDSIIENSIDNPFLLAEIKRWMARCLVKLNRTQEASHLAAEVVKAERQFGISLNTVLALNEYASTLVASGRMQESMAILDEVLLICSQRGFEHQAAITKLYQAELLLKIGEVLDAYNYASSLKDYFEGQGFVSAAARASLVMATSLIVRLQDSVAQQNKLQQNLLQKQAVFLCEKIIEESYQYNLQEEVYKSHYNLGKLWVILGNLEVAAEQFKAAIAQIESILGDLVYDLSPSFLHTTWAVYEDMISLCLQYAQPEKALCYLEQARSISLRQYLNRSITIHGRDGEEKSIFTLHAPQSSSAMMLRFEQELKEWQERYREYNVQLTNIDSSVSPAVDSEVIQAEIVRCEVKISEIFERLHLNQFASSFKSTVSKDVQHQVHQIDILRLRQQLSHDQLLLIYFLYQDSLVIFGVTHQELVTYEIADGVEQLEHLLPLLHAHLDPRGWSHSEKHSSDVVCRLLTRLYHILVEPVTNLLPSRSGLLTIVPYGPLHKLPFHALYDGSRFLVENFQVNYLPASSLLLHFTSSESQLHHNPDNASIAAKKPLVFGYSENGYLQRVKDEALTIASLLGGSCFLENEATIDRLIEQASQSSIIHLATHGQSRLDAPNFSYVRLADGQLNAIDAFGLDLRECELVTLSGCETGLALSGGGDEQLGLGRAFLAAGASSLVMSLWPVEDNATNKLMKHFYEGLLKGESKVQALRVAQCHLMQDTTLNYAHPYFWAAFRLVGDPAPLKSQVANFFSSTFEIEPLKEDISSVSKM